MVTEPTRILSQSRFDRLAVADVMTMDPVTIRVDESLQAAEHLMVSFAISGLPVIDSNGHLVGVVSRTNLLFEGESSVSRLIRGRSSALRVGELMSSPPITILPSATLTEAARLMHDERVHRLVVVDEHTTPIGVLSAMDYVTLIADG
jgi:CBS domain-containing protein